MSRKIKRFQRHGLPRRKSWWIFCRLPCAVRCLAACLPISLSNHLQNMHAGLIADSFSFRSLSSLGTVAIVASFQPANALSWFIVARMKLLIYQLATPAAVFATARRVSFKLVSSFVCSEYSRLLLSLMDIWSIRWLQNTHIISFAYVGIPRKYAPSDSDLILTSEATHPTFSKNVPTSISSALRMKIASNFRLMRSQSWT